MVNTRGMAAAKAGEGSGATRAESSKPPPRKKTKTSKEATSTPKRRGKMSLARLLDLSPEVFNEVATHLLPADLLSLARSNKFFRKLLMSRTSQLLWKRAISNIQDLPECPPQLSEPAYTSLIYSKTCSGCGARALRQMDPFLLVRFCNKCRDDRTFTLTIFQPCCALLPRSHAANMFNRYCILRADYDEIRLNPLINNNASDWYKARKAKIDVRQEFGTELQWFLGMMEDERDTEMDELKSQRREQIKERIIEKGWTEEDMVPSPANHNEWRKLVSQPKPLTDRIWNNLYPKLLPMLQSNREHREKIERGHRRRLRTWRLQDLIAEMRNALPPLVRVTQKRPSKSKASKASSSSLPDVLTASYPDVKLPYPFPSNLELLSWPMLKAIMDEDTSPEEAETKFEAIRDEVDQKIDEWRDAIERDLIEIWNAGRDEAEDMKPDKRKRKAVARTTKSKANAGVDAVKREPSPESELRAPKLTLPEFTVTFTKLDGTTTTNLSELSPNLQLLLRADTIFKSETLEYTYPSIVPRAVPVAPMVGLPDEITFGARWDASKFERDDECSAVAKVMLGRMSRSDATSGEMKALGANFKCGRCTSVSPETWDNLVHHFCNEEKNWKHAQEMIRTNSMLNLVYYHTHTLSPKDVAPLAYFMTPQQSMQYIANNAMDYMPMTQCILCEDVGVDARYLYSFEDDECPIMRHLETVHDVEPAVLGRDFRQLEWDMDFYDPWELGDEGESDSDMDDPFWDLMF